MLKHMVLSLSHADQTVSQYISFWGRICLGEMYYNCIFMAFIRRPRDFLFSSTPEVNGLPIVLLGIVLALFLSIMGIVAVFVYRRWKKKRHNLGYNPADEEVTMNSVTVQPAETVS